MLSLQNFQVIKQSIHSEGVPEEICKKINRMRLHELSRLPERDSQSVFSTKEKKKQNQNHKNRKECHEHCTNFHGESKHINIKYVSNIDMGDACFSALWFGILDLQLNIFVL